MQEITVQDANRRSNQEEALLLDVREDDEWAAGRAPQAVHLKMSTLTVDDVPRGRPVLALCRAGSRSAQVANALAQQGYDVRNVTGGMQEWLAAGLPVVTETGDAGQVI